jgi:hypothetical protein
VIRLAKYDKLITLDSLKTAIIKLKSLISEKASKIDVDTSLNTKVSKSGDTMTGKLTVPQVETGSDSGSYFQTRKFRGEGNASTYYHGIDFGYAGHNQVDFHEYGGTWNFYQNTSGTSTSGKLVASIQPDGVHAALKGNADTATKATQDSDGNAINTTYAKSTDISSAVKTAMPTNVSSFTNDSKYCYAAMQTGSIDDLYSQRKDTPGGVGSISLTKKSSGTGSEIPAGWYNYAYLPHRVGGPTGDNGNYGTILLFPMTFIGTSYIVQCAGGSIDLVTPIVQKSSATVTLSTSAWSSSLTATVSVASVTADSDVIVAYQSTSQNNWDTCMAAGIRCSNQESGKLTFTAKSKPTASVTLVIMVFK